jgi:hypothetical protein
MVNHIWLVVLTILKNMNVNGKDYPIYEMDKQKYLKPPTSIRILPPFRRIFRSIYGDNFLGIHMGIVV